MKGRCIYCKKEKALNREHAFPQSLLQKGAPGWIINNHLCTTCNSNLGKLDVVLSKRSHIAFVWDQLQRELGSGAESIHDSIYHKPAAGVNPVGLFLANPVYDNYIVLHEFKEENDGTINPANSVDVLRPQIILTQYAEGQTSEKVVAENLRRINDTGSIDYDAQEGIFCLLGNTYIFPPQAAWRFFGKVEEFKSKFITDYPHTRYDLRVIHPEEGRGLNKSNAFYNSLKSEMKEVIKEKKFENPEMFEAAIHAIPDQEGMSYFTRAIAKVAFHCFLYHYSEFTGHESIFNNIKEFIYTGAPNQFVAEYKKPETGNPVYDSATHFHGVSFFVQGEDIGCKIDFFTGLLPSSFSYQITLAGDPDNSAPSCDHVGYIPFIVHPKSPMKRRIFPVSDLGIINEPRKKEGEKVTPFLIEPVNDPKWIHVISESKNNSTLLEYLKLEYRRRT